MPPTNILTPWEEMVKAQLLTPKSGTEIASALDVSYPAISSASRNIYRKLDVRDRYELMVKFLPRTGVTERYPAHA